jgi:hypothetical protein
MPGAACLHGYRWGPARAGKKDTADATDVIKKTISYREVDRKRNRGRNSVPLSEATMNGSAGSLVTK